MSHIDVSFNIMTINCWTQIYMMSLYIFQSCWGSEYIIESASGYKCITECCDFITIFRTHKQTHKNNMKICAVLGEIIKFFFLDYTYRDVNNQAQSWSCNAIDTVTISILLFKFCLLISL